MAALSEDQKDVLVRIGLALLLAQSTEHVIDIPRFKGDGLNRWQITN
jgi:hypothetical protein